MTSDHDTTAKPHRLRRRLLWSVLALLLVLAGYTTWSNLRVFTLTARIDIDASPDQVWEVLADLEAYPQWNPFMVSAKGKIEVGATLTNTMRGADGEDMVFDPTVLVADPGEQLRWVGKVPPGLLFDGEHSFVLTEISGGRTRLTQSEKFTGALVLPVQNWLTDDTLPQFHAMNEALAKRVTELK